MADELKLSPKRALAAVLEESANLKRKLKFKGPEPIRPDSRYSVGEIAGDHVSFKLLGDDVLVLPYSSIVCLRVQPTEITIVYR